MMEETFSRSIYQYSIGQNEVTRTFTDVWKADRSRRQERMG